MSVTVTLADGSTDQHTDTTIDGAEHRFSYWITAAGHLTVYRCPDHHQHGPDEHPETTEAVYSPTGWLKVTGRQRDQEPPTPAPY
jgi:hypothetical protein